MVAVALSIGATLVAGCGNSDTSENEGPPSASDEAVVKKAQDVIAQLKEPPGSYQSPPTSAPEHKPDQQIWIMSCGEAYDLCARPAAAAVDAVEALGWKAQIFDTKGDPTAANSGIRQALAQGADGIYTYYIDCSYVLSALKQANDEGVPVVAAESGPCPGQGIDVAKVDTSTGGKGHYTFIVNYVGGIGDDAGKEISFTEVLRELGAAAAYAGIANQDGRANALIYMDDAAYGASQVAEGAKAAFDECSTCQAKVETVPYGDIGTDALRERVQQDLLKNPNVNTMVSNYDSLLTGGIQQAVRATGRDIYLVAGEGGPLGADSVRKGDAAGGASFSIEWESWAGIDALLRVQAGKEPAPSGIGILWYEKDANLPESGGVEAPFDYETIYKKAWGVE